MQVALIDEQSCIGCTICLQRCPVDAIVGAERRMHTVIGSECTGCVLCVAPCPVDCITMVERAPETPRADPRVARARARFRQQRLAR
ncbi:MAG: RnfABCDGE type electron transport complex subunit B, partial [Proteobacteria bacterium]|nr:RnfABCDGE type electron transport complex subunit B [Burkholderiales bacterium]